MSRRITSAATLVAVTLVMTPVVAGCVPGLAADPRFATNSGARPQGATTPKPPPSGPPPIALPKNDLSWHDCTAQVFNDAAQRPAPGVQLDCANYDADLDPANGGSGTVSIGVVRARSNQTPKDAGPLVFTTGSDLPSSTQLPVWLSRAGTDVLQTHPVVAVDRRGIGMSTPVDCRDRTDRQAMRDQAQFQNGDDPVANLSAVSDTATMNCTDALAPAGDSAYDNAHAASDIERLRSLWDVPAVALVGIGNGAQLALSYAASRPDRVARLILDSPIALGVNAETAAEQQVKGQQAALDAFAAQCIAVNCALGDPKGAVSALLADARAGKGPGGASLAEVARAITVALGYPSGGRVDATTSLANAVAAARSGDANQLNSLITHADAIQDSDGQFVNSCSDAINRPTPDRVRELVVAWGKLYPQFGTVAALNLVKCVHWPTGSPTPPPKSLKIDVLLSGVQNDPIVGIEGVAATAATIINANAASKRVMWQGIGHGASIYSPCAVPPLIGYLNSGKLPGTDTYCPA
jgi:pimeloyl-ACP methyl ester carboxylesterase